MTRSRITAVAALVVGILVFGSVPGAALSPERPAATVAGPTTASGVAVDTGGGTAGNGTAPIVERTAVTQVPNASRVRARITYEIPAAVTDLAFRIESTAVTVRTTEGVERRGERTFEWTGEANASVTVVYPVDEGFYLDDRHPAPVGGTDEWGIVTRPETRTSWDFEGENPGIGYVFETDGMGAAGSDLAYLGAHTRYETQVGTQRVNLVVPQDGGPLSEPATIRGSLATAASLNLSLGEEPALVIAAPSRVRWAPDGLSVGPDARVSASRPADEPVNVWVHEYVHTRQRRDAVTSRTRWLIEGAAQYYGALVNLQRNLTEPSTFRRVLRRGTEEVVLAEPATWRGTGANYDKGALVVATIDLAIRSATDGNATFAEVMRAWSESTTFDAAAFERAVASVAGDDVARVARQYTETDAAPPITSTERYAAILGTDEQVSGTVTVVEQSREKTVGAESGSQNDTAHNQPDRGTRSGPGDTGTETPGSGPPLRLFAVAGAIAIAVAALLFGVETLVSCVREGQ